MNISALHTLYVVGIVVFRLMSESHQIDVLWCPLSAVRSTTIETVIQLIDVNGPNPNPKWNETHQMNSAVHPTTSNQFVRMLSGQHHNSHTFVYTHISIIQLAALAARHTKTLLLFIYRYSCPTKLFAGINKNQSLLHPHIDAVNETSVREMSECERMNNIYFFPMTKLTWARGMTTWRITEYLK